MEELLVALLVALAAFAAAAGVTVVLAVLLVRAVVGTLRPPAQRAALRARTLGIGAAADVARVRWQLQDAVASSGRAVAVARAQGWPTGDAAALQSRLRAVAQSLDAELALAAAEPDGSRRAAMLADLRAQVHVVAGSAADLRRGLAAGSGRCRGDEIARLADDCRLELRALRG